MEELEELGMVVGAQRKKGGYYAVWANGFCAVVCVEFFFFPPAEGMRKVGFVCDEGHWSGWQEEVWAWREGWLAG